jgi:hypothetical protein
VTPSMNPSRDRLTRWAMRGALILAAFASVVGGIFNVMIAIAMREVPPDAGIAFWAWFLLRSTLAWGGGALFFGAALGWFASMIWRDDSAQG